MSTNTAFNGELHADNYTGVSSCWPSAHESYGFTIMMTSHCEVECELPFVTL